MAQILYCDRSRVQTYQRCRRLRWLEYHEGANGRGLSPKRKSIHLVVGSAVHAGLEVLLRAGQQWLWDYPDMTVADLFTVTGQADGKTVARQIEDAAVVAALEDFAQEWGEGGVELDPEEQAQRATEQAAGGGQAGSAGQAGQDSPIIIDFGDLAPAGAIDQAFAQAGLDVGWIDPGKTALAVQTRQTDAEYLREEIASLVEGLVRTYSRRRLRPLLSDFTVLEIEREGEWKLGKVELPQQHQWDIPIDYSSNIIKCSICGCQNNDARAGFPCWPTVAELHFLSRHDALLLERSTGYLYLQSFKTTGAWDRRKELDAQVDMQGLSEAMDVERRMEEAWRLIQKWQNVVVNREPDLLNGLSELALEFRQDNTRANELVSSRVVSWLRSLPDPPTILGVRYEYLLKGARRKDKKLDPFQPDRWVQDSPLCRAWKQEGIIAEDRRWAWSYDWFDEGGKSRRLDYRSWQKAPVWKSMVISEWIDLLDQGKVQEGALTEQGEPMDALAEQFVPVVTVYRSADEMRDLLEQLEAQEVQVAKDVAAVREAERTGGYAAKRSALNRLFPQNRQACSYPGICPMRATASQLGFCFGTADPFHDQEVLARFQARQPNHPQEGLVEIKQEGSE